MIKIGYKNIANFWKLANYLLTKLCKQLQIALN